MSISLRIFCLVALTAAACLAVPFVVSRDVDAQARTTMWPQRGAECTVFIRGDVLRTPRGVTETSVNGTDVSLGGKFDWMDEQWIVITVDGGETRWIPQTNVLWIRFAGHTQ